MPGWGVGVGEHGWMDGWKRNKQEGMNVGMQRDECRRAMWGGRTNPQAGLSLSSLAFLFSPLPFLQAESDGL